MGAWALDYLGFWAGNDGMVRHSKMQFRGPSFEGDVTYVEGEVAAKQTESEWGVPVVTIKVKMANQEGVALVDGSAEVELPLA
jgi:acyl dehydratase